LLLGAVAGAKVLDAIAFPDDNDDGEGDGSDARACADDSSDAGRNPHRRHHQHGRSYRWVGPNDTTNQKPCKDPSTNKKGDSCR
jgi:hypothetical protein